MTKSKTLMTITAFAFLFTLVVFSQKTYANVCNPPEGWFKKIQDSFDRNIRETAVNHLTATAADFTWNMGTGTEMAEFMNCADFVAPNFPGLQSEIQSWGCGATPTEVCENIMNQYNTSGSPSESTSYNYQKFAEGKVSGSLLGMGYYVHNTLNYDPVPVNMAYFFYDYGNKLPVIGDRVFAADTIDYQHTLIRSVLDIWKITRNVAYGLMAIIMLYVGITIISRKRINPQVVVNVQYALPRVILALILIVFSYPIGAFITSLAWSLFHSSPIIINTLYQSVGGSDATSILQMGVGSIILVVMGIIVITGGSGLAVGILLALAIIVLLGLYFFAVFKALLLYLKMLIAIIIAPLQFAIGAIPGQDDKIKDWFLRMVSYGLSIVAINSVITLVHLFGVVILNNGLDPSTGYLEGFSGYLYAVFGIMFIFMYGYGFAYSVPAKIEAALVGSSGKRK